MPFTPTLYIGSLALNNCNDASPSSFTDLRTGQPVFGGALVQGDYFDLTNKEAAQLSYTTNGTLYAGRYRRVQVDSGATAANVKTGTIGLMPSLVVVPGNTAPLGNVVTSYDVGIGLASNVRPVVFLNAITPGNYGFVQELGFATVLGAASIQKAAPAIGDLLNSATGGLVDDPTSQIVGVLAIGVAIDKPQPATLFRTVLQYLPIIQD